MEWREAGVVDNTVTKTPEKAWQRTRGSVRDVLSPIVAILALLGFGGFTIYLVLISTVQEPEWTRDVYLYGGIEAVAFAAAGFLFGSEVRRRQAEQAIERALEADATAASAQVQAAVAEANGKALTDAINVKLSTINQGAASSTQTPSGNEAGNSADVARTDLTELSLLAARLFPTNTNDP